MRGASARPRAYLAATIATVLCGASGPALAQGVPSPLPPKPNPTVVREGPVHVPPDASGIDLSEIDTSDLELLYFDPGQTYLTPYIGRAFTNALEFHKKKFHWTPWDRTTVLIKDFGDYGNAAARGSPNNAVLLDVAPLSLTMETFSPGERFFTLNNHELAHVATMDVWNQKDAWWRKFLHGKPMPLQEHPESILWNYLATPRTNVPRWYLEGSAVFFETWMAGGLGRAQGGYDEMVWRAKVRDNDRFFSPLGLESEGIAVDFQVGVNDYLYGTRFFSYLALTYGPEKAVDWLRRPDGGKAFYAARFREVFGKRLDEVWDDWIRFEHEFQKANLAKLSANIPLTTTQPISAHGLGSISRGFVDTKTHSLIAAFRYPGTIGFVGRLDLSTGKLTKLQEIKGMMLYKVTSLAFDPDARKAYYTEDNGAFRDIVSVDVDTGRKQMLLRDARIGDLVIDPRDKTMWGIRHQNGFATIVRLPAPYRNFNQIHSFKYGQIPFDLDISPDGTLMSASFGEVSGDQTLRVWRMDSLYRGEPQEVSRLSLPPSMPEGFTFAPDGRTMYGTSYFTGASNVFRFDIPSKKYDAVSNASTGFFRPIAQPDGSLIAYEYSGEGLQPVRFQPQVREDLGNVEFLGTRVVNTHPELKQWGVGSPAKIPLEDLITNRGKYSPVQERKFAGTYPIIEGYKGAISPGWYFHWEDPLQFNQVSAEISVSPFDHMKLEERLHAKLMLKTLNWDVKYLHNAADFYDIFGPVKRSRRGDSVIATYNKTVIYDPPRQLDMFATGAVFTGLEVLPTAQNVPGPKNIGSVEVGAKYTNTRRSLGGVDHEKGIAWRVTAGLDYAQNRAFPRLSGGIRLWRPAAVREQLDLGLR